jgi:hypothetical protein
MAGGSTVLSTTPRPWVPTGRQDISWALRVALVQCIIHTGRGCSSTRMAPSAQLDCMVGVGDVGLFGGQSWKERDRSCHKSGVPLSNLLS